MTNYFKSSVLRPFFALFAQVLAKMNFPGKKALTVFKCLNYIPLCQKSEKTNESFLRKMLDCRTGRQTDTDRQTQTDRHRQTDTDRQRTVIL